MLCSYRGSERAILDSTSRSMSRIAATLYAQKQTEPGLCQFLKRKQHIHIFIEISGPLKWTYSKSFSYSTCCLFLSQSERKHTHIHTNNLDMEISIFGFCCYPIVEPHTFSAPWSAWALKDGRFLTYAKHLLLTLVSSRWSHSHPLLSLYLIAGNFHTYVTAGIKCGYNNHIWELSFSKFHWPDPRWGLLSSIFYNLYCIIFLYCIFFPS